MGKLKLVFVCCLLALVSIHAAAQRVGELAYDPSSEYQFGRPNPDAPAQLSQFHFMIGKNDCINERLNNATGEWVESRRSWDARYHMNGYAIIDGGKSGPTTNSNLRVYDQAIDQWRVHFYSMPVFSTGVWTGGLVGENMVLKQPQKAPGTDIDGFSRLTFYNISDTAFDWIGEWVSEDESFVNAFWRISCQKLESASR